MRHCEVRLVPAFALLDHPFFPCDAMRVDASLLDAWVSEYAVEAGADADVASFLFGRLPVRVFDGILGGGECTAADESAVWLMHLSGYFGGVWLRAAIRAAQPDNPIVKAGSAPTREGFDLVAGRAAAALDAARASADDLRSYLQSTLPEWVAGFGYNQGYLLQILEAPPGGVSVPVDVLQPRGPLGAEYGRPRLKSLASLRGVALELVAGERAGWETVAKDVRTGQVEAEKNGRAVWSSGLSVDGFTQAAYAQLVDLSSSFLEVTQAVALTAVRAICEDDEAAGRRAARANACLVPWTGSYALGLMDPTRDGLAESDVLPRIVP